MDQKTINLLDKAPNQPSRCRTKNWIEINHDSRKTYDKDNQIKFKTSMIKSSLCDYSDAHILVSGTITVAALAVGRGNTNLQVAFKNSAPFTD